MFSLSPLITYLFVDINDCLYIPSSQKKIPFSNIIALQKKINTPYIFAVVKDKNSDKISYFETSNFQTNKINPVTNQEIDKLIYCMLKLDQTQKPIINYLGSQCETGDKKCFLDTCFKATSRDVEAQYMLGTYYKEGKGVAQNLTEAYKWFKIAAEVDHREAQFELGICYNEGKGIKKDCKKANIYFTIAAKKNHIEAIYQLGLNYWNGQGVVKNVDTASSLFSLAKEEGHLLSKIKFDEWHETLQVKVEGQIHHNLGAEYYYGDFIGKDIDKALKFFMLAANVGCAESAYWIGNHYDDDRLEDAIHWLTKAADLGNKKAQFLLGCYYKKGHGVIESFEKAFYYVELSANQGLPEAQMFLSLFYQHGLVVEQNLERAAFYLKLSSFLGLKDAQHRLGIYYERGIGVTQDFKEAAKLFELSANQGYEKSQLKMAAYYKTGKGVKPDLKKSKKFLELGLAQGSVESNLGWGKTNFLDGEYNFDKINWNEVSINLEDLNLTATIPNYLSANFENGKVSLRGGLADIEYWINTDYKQSSYSNITWKSHGEGQNYVYTAIDGLKQGAKYAAEVFPKNSEKKIFVRCFWTGTRKIEMATHDTNEKRRSHFFNSLFIE